MLVTLGVLGAVLLIGYVFFVPCVYLLALVGFLVLFTYYAPFLHTLLPVPDLKKRYNAEWALVTGGSTGIGKAIVAKLATQGLNVIIVGLPDDAKNKFLSETTKEMQKKFPKCKFISIGVKFAPDVDYMKPIIEKTKDLKVQLIFNNAGYIVAEFFNQVPVGAQVANVECNAVAPVKITHHFLSKLIDTNTRGCVVFTSSAAAYMPAAFSSMYGATKAFVSAFGAALQVENASRGVDVCVVHPSPVASNFYNGIKPLEALKFFNPFQVQPDVLPDEIFRSIGRVGWRDIGGIAIGFRTLFQIINMNFAVLFAAFLAPISMPDFKRYNKQPKAGDSKRE
mmetsp:Transcript_18383/g.45137  ORF Transcript_18383/g.45137 Transcript_18383/m.45137 type:complete len:338 (-) Transcript_18383:291-1304(-)|eukprot:CAMPEP_0114519822 /NCGR_PEP_ID=MMETSP0109-20121206/19224_1 /TAXON_ID=29199 /ORGANISM="Chlorarachnion reptans, Strain CCCM449" /LENGTH=337 /DNA_ID=CAMNT_0001700619 /DNA_START=235 /DNA_END=1251 /DNA_ORIENTATION=-